MSDFRKPETPEESAWLALQNKRTLEEDILANGTVDWIDPAFLIQFVRFSGISDSGSLRDLAVGVLARLLFEGLVEIGDVRDGFTPWDLSPAEALKRVVREWSDCADPTETWLFWLNTTPAGVAIGEAVLAREGPAYEAYLAARERSLPQWTPADGPEADRQPTERIPDSTHPSPHFGALADNVLAIWKRRRSRWEMFWPGVPPG